MCVRKRYLLLVDHEWRMVLMALNRMRSKLIAQGRYTDAVDQKPLFARKAGKALTTGKKHIILGPDRRKGAQTMNSVLKYASPLGTLTIAEQDGAITALVMAGQKNELRHLPAEAQERETALLRRAAKWLDDYFAQKRPAPGALPLAPAGAAFQKRVWQALLTIPYGETVTYGELAGRLGSSARAVGGAVGRNPISILIPCHRVLGAGGTLTGYDGGLARKQQLLALERQ